MKKTSCKRGFTLIELLVVILIIGILAAVAVPQYRRAVEKSRATQALTLITALGKAQIVYRLSNGEYAHSLSALDVDVPCDGNGKWHSSGIWDTCSIGDWSLSISGDPGNTQMGVDIGHWQGPYAGAGFGYFLGTRVFEDNTIICLERRTSGVVFGKTKGDFCQKVMGFTIEIPGTTEYYAWKQ